MTIVRRPPPSLLVERAHDYLRTGPAPAAELVAHICHMGGVPSAVAEEIAEVMLAPHRAFVRESDGRWALSEATPPLVPAMPAQAPLGIDLRRPVVAPQPALGSLPYVVVDVETTGGRARHGDRVTEVAAVVMREGRVVEVFETLVNPQRAIPPWITALTNISWAMVKDAPTFREVAPRLLDVLEGRIFVAHNATFDWNFICAEVERATGERLEGERVCTVRLARRLLPQLRRRSLDYVCLHYGVENGARHRAGGDALATAHVLQRLLRDAAGRGIASWTDLRALLDARTGRARRRRRPPFSALPRPVDRDTTA